MRHRASIFFVSLFLLSFAARASAYPSWMSEDRSGRFMFNFKSGLASGARDAITMGAIVLDFGIALDEAKRAYLLFPLQFQFADVNYFVLGSGGDFTVGYIMVPLGFEYDIPIHALPGFSIAPRLVAGYAALTSSCSGCNTANAGFIAPEVDLKMTLAKRWNVGLEPFSLPVFIASSNGNTATSISYRILFFGGVNF